MSKTATQGTKEELLDACKGLRASLLALKARNEGPLPDMSEVTGSFVRPLFQGYASAYGLAANWLHEIIAEFDPPSDDVTCPRCQAVFTPDPELPNLCGGCLEVTGYYDTDEGRAAYGAFRARLAGTMR